MVRGIEKFKEYFKSNVGQYVFIGGTACDIILGEEGIPFRQTKDLDMVIIIEALDDEFINTFIQFVRDGGYEHINKGSGENQFYRFSKPKDNQFPYMIELFSRKPDYLLALDNGLAPVHVSDDVVSLSAILLDDEYYSLLVKGTIQVEETSVLNLTSLVLFKMKAWLDLTRRKNAGEEIDSKNIKKHKNDVIRLISNIEPGTFVEITGQVKSDVLQFLDAIREEKVDMKSLGIREFTYEELLEKIEECYGVKESNEV